MELTEVLLKRRSVRQYTNEPVSQEQIELLLKAAMSAPSACNKCPWEFFVVENEEVLEKLRKATPYSKMQAPLAIIVCGNMNRALPKPSDKYWVEDCSAATENILLQATDLGLGSVWCGVYPQRPNVKTVTEIMKLEDHLIPLNIIYIGHPQNESEPRTQYKEEYIHYIK